MREERFLARRVMQPTSHQAFASSFGLLVDSPCHFLADVLVQFPDFFIDMSMRFLAPSEAPSSFVTVYNSESRNSLDSK